MMNGQAVRVEKNQYLEVTVAGHGVKGACEGPIIYVEYNDKGAILYVWDDIEEEDPTHVINLGRAMEGR